jgi:glyoxylase-like metal-dependent hydrolase (beta-lactamase superfamily II)
MSEYQIYAIRYGHHDRKAAENFIAGDDHATDMPLDYFVWAIVGADRTFVLDTGFDAASAKQRSRTLLRPVAEGLQAVGIDPSTTTDVVISHMHFDHAGNVGLFPNAKFHIQDAEMQYCTGRCMTHGMLRAPFAAKDVATMVHTLYEGRVCFHEGVSELAPGITLHKLGGHTKGLQVMRVRTRRGWVVLASDALHLYANLEREHPFPVLVDIDDYLEGLRTVRKLADSPAHIIPGHDPLVLAQYPRLRGDLADVVRLDADPIA